MHHYWYKTLFLVNFRLCERNIKCPIEFIKDEDFQELRFTGDIKDLTNSHNQFLNSFNKNTSNLVLNSLNQHVDLMSSFDRQISAADRSDSWKSASSINTTRPKKQLSNIDEKLLNIRSDLNKIAPENEQKIISRVCENITEECFEKIIPFFIEKCAWDFKYHKSLGKLCLSLNDKFLETFKKILIQQCQEEFKNEINENWEDEEISKFTKRRSGIITFLVELLKIKLINPTVILLCIDCMINVNSTISIERNINHTAEMLKICIPVIYQINVEPIKNNIFSNFSELFLYLSKLLENKKIISNRVQFNVIDTINIGKKFSII